MARTTDGQNQKVFPCGDNTVARDPNRVTTFAPGATITVVFDEPIDHPGHFRIAFDADGQDAFVDPTGFDDVVNPQQYNANNPAQPVLLDNIADRNSTPTDMEYQVQVTLPNISCENCTLQLIQVMTDKAPWGPGGGNDLYYQCADIRLGQGGQTPAVVDAGTTMPPAHDHDESSSGGCALSTPRSGSSAAWAMALFFPLLFWRLRRRSLAARS